MSDRQKAILSFISDFIAQRKYSPSIREICQGTGIPSTSYIVYQLTTLKNAGYIERDECVSRSIRLTPQAEQVCQPVNHHLIGGRIT